MSTFRLHFLQHVPFEGAGFLAHWAQRRGLATTCTRFYLDEPLPPLQSVDAVVVLGGPMSVYDEAAHPWLVAEKTFLRAAIDQGTYLLGICLGAQLLAHVLGAAVYPNGQREIGWFPVQLTPAARALPWLAAAPDEVTVLHWHGDTFDLVPGAVRLARSPACANQAFLYGRNVLGLQFHLEMTSTGLLNMVHHCADELERDTWVQTANDMFRKASFAPSHHLLGTLLDQALATLVPPVSSDNSS